MTPTKQMTASEYLRWLNQFIWSEGEKEARLAAFIADQRAAATKEDPDHG